jgi:SAM-dependent methyltransferase
MLGNKKWILKVGLQKIISLVPFSTRLNFFFQRHFGGLRTTRLSSHHDAIVYRMSKLIEILNRHERHVRDATILEIGTGWNLASAAFLSIYEPRRIVTIDTHRHVRQSLFTPSVTKLSRGCKDLQQFALDSPTRPISAEETRKLYLDFTESRNIHYSAPADARHIGLRDETVDTVYSIAVFEHVPAADLPDVLDECRRILKPEGLMFHHIQPYDHSSQYGASPIEFLRFSPFVWERLVNNHLSYQNRLRDSQYRSLFEAHGFEIVWHHRDMDPDIESKLAGIRIADEFSRFGIEDLATYYCWYLCRKARP